jgi:hypothetical protein
MNKLSFVTFSFFILLSSLSFSQTSCNNKDKLDRLLKTADRNTDRYLALKSARFYWWRRCQCESGNVVDQGGEKAIIEYLATGYDNSQWAKGKYSDIPTPNKRDFKTGDCFSTHQFKKTVDHSDCQSINYSQQEDPQRYITQYEIYKCMCEKGVNSVDEEKQLLASISFNAKNAKAYYTGKSLHLTIPNKCTVLKSQGKGSSGSTSSTTQQQLMKRFANYNNAMGLKKQGIGIAKAFSNQVKNYSQLNKANTPEALLQNFNSNMQAISDLQTQNKADNLNQLENTLNSTLNDLNAGNHEGAMFSALSLLDQGEAKREARRKAEAIKQNLVYQNQKQMSAFYLKAVELNNNAIAHYYKRIAYVFTEEEEDYLFKYIDHHKCFETSMSANFNYSSASWSTNNCPVPVKKNAMVNNLITKDEQYIRTAKRKQALFQQTKRYEFQQGAMKFAGLAATTNPKTEYYYLMGHYAGVNNPIVAYASFLTVKSKNSKYFYKEKSAEFNSVKLSLEKYFKQAIEENNQDIIKNIVGAGLHQTVSIDGNAPIIYAIKIDQADVVQAFLNTELEGKKQSVINKKVKDVIMLASSFDAPNTIKKFVDMDFPIDFIINKKSPASIAINEKSIFVLNYLNSSKAINTKDALKVKSAFEKLDEIAYNEAGSKNTKLSYETYLSTIPNGIHQEEAKGNINRIIEEQHYNDAAREENISQLELYLKKYPNGSYTIKVKDQLSNLHLKKGDLAFENEKWSSAKFNYEEAQKYSLNQAISSKYRKAKDNVFHGFASGFFTSSRGAFGINYLGLGINKFSTTFKMSFDIPVIFTLMNSAGSIENNTYYDSNDEETNIIKTGKTIQGSVFRVSLGKSKKIINRLWLQAGLGLALYRKTEQIIEEGFDGTFDSSSSSIDKEWANNKDLKKTLLFIEAGMYFRIHKNTFFHYGISFQKGTVHEFGLAFTFN